MPTTNFTSLLGLALPTTGDLSGTWGDEVNNYITSYLDASVAGALTVNADTTLTKTTGSALGATSSQYAILIASGHSTNITITAPAASKAYLVLNKSGTYTVKIRGAGPTTGITVAANEAALVAWDGSDFALVGSTDVAALIGTLGVANGGTGLTTFTAANNALYSTSSSALTAGTLPVAAGGTGATTLTANNVILGNGTSAVQFVAPGTTGNVLTSNGTTWTSSAPTAGLIGTTQSATPFKTFYGYQAGNVATGASNTLIGYQSGLLVSTGTNNTAVGYFSLKASTTGTDNSAFGYNSQFQATGSSNTSFGSSAASSLTTGSFNTAVGVVAGASATGSYNSAFGWGSLNQATSGYENAAFGARAFQQATSGYQNTALGFAAMRFTDTANNNVAVGYNAGLGISSGSLNTIVGSQAAGTLSTGSNNVIVGYSASSSSGSVTYEIVVGAGLTGKGTQTAFIGGTSGAYNGKNVTTWETTSDVRIKRNIVDSPKGLAEIKQLRVRNFNYKPVEEMPTDDNGKPLVDNLDPDRLITGFIAQELQQVLPECVNTTANGLLSVSSDPIIYALVKAVQELAAEVERLKQGA